MAVGLRESLIGDGTPPQKHVCFNVTNIGERAVRVNTVGWAVGKGKTRRFAIQPVLGRYSSKYPIELAHGQNANFMVDLAAVANWFSHIANDFVRDLSDQSLNTFVAQIHTSVGQTIEIKPDRGLIEALKSVGRKDQ